MVGGGAVGGFMFKILLQDRLNFLNQLNLLEIVLPVHTPSSLRFFYADKKSMLCFHSVSHRLVYLPQIRSGTPCKGFAIPGLGMYGILLFH